MSNGGTKNALWTAIGIISGNWNLTKTNFFHIFPRISSTYYNLIQEQLQEIRKYEKLRINNLYCINNNLWTIPLSVKIQDRFKFPFRPLSITEQNICSNDGLKTVIKNLSFRFFKSDKLNIVVCDTNIYWRLSKKYYLTPKPQSLRPIPIFGLWHPGKMLIECIWRSYLSYLIAPAYHYLYPNATILYKVRLSHSLELFIQLYLAYSSWINENEISVLEKSDEGYNQLKNSKLLFEFFLPLVSSYFF